MLGFDGRGSMQLMTCKNANPKNLEVDIHETKSISKPRDFRIHIAIAPTKQMERTEWFIEKCVEIGIDEISFLKSRYSVRDVIKAERVEKTILAAARQSGNFIFPKWNPVVSIESFMRDHNPDAAKYMAHLNEADQKHFRDIPKGRPEYLILIGPEGDFSEEEVEMAKNAGFESLSLGKSRLRTETAGIVACTAINTLV
jgi:16S rRNA (uracil1498-N3)-methyltransferase